MVLIDLLILTQLRKENKKIKKICIKALNLLHQNQLIKNFNIFKFFNRII